MNSYDSLTKIELNLNWIAIYWISNNGKIKDDEQIP